MVELIHESATRVIAPEGVIYRVLIVGEKRFDGMWHGWNEFQAVDGSPGLATDPEIAQPTRSSLVDWAQGLERSYFEEALARARAVAECPHAAAVVSR